MTSGLNWQIVAAIGVEILLLMGTLVWGALAFLSQGKLFGLVRQRRPDVHARLTTFMGVAGGRNSLRGVRYIQSDEDMDDEAIGKAKIVCRALLTAFIWLFISLLLFPVACIGVAFLKVWIEMKG